MDHLAAEELQFLTINDILRESTTILRRSPKTFYQITLTLIFPLSFAILAHSLFIHPLINQLDNNNNGPQLTPVNPITNPSRLDNPPPPSILLLPIPLRFLSPLHRRRRLHRRISLYCKGRIFLYHYIWPSISSPSTQEIES
ncbi:hypothetical protein ACFE04_004156 [Oxalis oulophora]